MGGEGGAGRSTGQVFPCTEQGIRDAIAESGGPHTFDCDGPRTVTTEAEIVIDNDVILDGERNLTVDGNNDHTVFRVSGPQSSVQPPTRAVELRGLTITNGRGVFAGGIGISARVEAVTLRDSIVNGNTAEVLEGCFECPTYGGNGGGIAHQAHGGVLSLINTIVSGNVAAFEGGGIFVEATFGSNSLIVTDSAVSGNVASEGGGIFLADGSSLTLTNSTVSRNTAQSRGGGIVIGASDPFHSTTPVYSSPGQ